MSTMMPALQDESIVSAAESGALVLLTQPMIGFEHTSRYAIRPLGSDYGSYELMTSLEEQGLSFVVVPPGAIFSDYRFEIPESDVELLGLRDVSDVETWVLVTRKGLPVPTVNLLGPLVVNRRTRVAAQLVLQDSGYGAAVAVNAGSARPLA
jgi:flagellar assembly factor FliW